jgi:hypothetical protein
MARNLVARELERLGGRPAWRSGTVTDNGNHILDVHGLRITDPSGLERTINQITGVVTVGLFAARPADVLLVNGRWRRNVDACPLIIDSCTRSTPADRRRDRQRAETCVAFRATR